MTDPDNEELLLRYITETRWRTSLAKIREAMEDIWSNTDALRIIHDYTDHGPLHSKRLITYTTQMLAANYGKHLSMSEIYILLASIYLHDIGMQCDVLRFPAIKARAEELGAQFDIEFNAATSSSYSIDEQKSIRNNHQYLAAAWIDYAYKTGDTVLGPAIKTVPEDFVIDLMDICKYHSKLSIIDCPVSFKHNPPQRKQLVAALLRFADELDIDANRVSIDTVKTFRLDPYNSTYWWLHNRTKILFSAPNLILYTIRLHPQDMVYGSQILSEFIIGFQTKNQPTLSVLAQNGIPLVISADSKVEVDDYAECLPAEIVHALQSMQRRDNSLISVSDQLRVMQEFAEAISNIDLSNVRRFWEGVNSVLDLWRLKLDVEYIAFFSGQTENDSILTLKASAGLLPRTGESMSMPHFNWRKAGLKTNNENDTYANMRDWELISLADTELLKKGFRGEANPFSSCTGLIPVGLPRGPYGVLVIGKRFSDAIITIPEQIILTISRDLTNRILLLYLVQILRSERAKWEDAFVIQAHRIRASLQSISSQVRVLDAERKGQMGFTSKDRKQAEEDLEETIHSLAQRSLVSQSGIRLYDVASSSREFVPFGEIILEAIADMQDIANERGIDIRFSDSISKLPLVYVNRTLMRYAFAYLLKNGIRSSFPSIETRRYIEINTSKETTKPGVVDVSVSSFGLGIKEIDLKRIFEWNARRIAYLDNTKDATNSEIRLWEVKYIIEGHGGHISASSVHYAGTPVTNKNINECITTFTVILPVGEGSISSVGK